MRLGLRVSICCLILVCVSPGSAKAWEFSLNAFYNWEYYWFGGMGNNGFFGPFNTDNSGPGPNNYGGTRGSAASMNGWLGNQIGQISSGSDLAVSQMYMLIDPEWRINEAVRVRGSYRIGSWATPWLQNSEGSLVRSRYVDGTAAGINRSFSPGYWNTLWLSAQLPWGIVAVGKRPGSFGLGIMFDAIDNADMGGVMLMTSYGPMRFGIFVAPWLWGSPFYYTLSDRNAQRSVDFGVGMTYDSGPFSFGCGGRYWRFRTGPESATFQGDDGPVPTGRYAVIPLDQFRTDGAFYAKYFNGKFFFNAEIDWAVGLNRRQKWLSQNPGTTESGRSLFAPTYEEHWRYMFETGFLTGPSKLTFLFAWIPGPDRRHGVFHDKQSDLRFAEGLSNVSVFRPFSLLLVYTYGGGNNSFTLDSANGYMTDAAVYALRYDYALASNLNLHTSLLHADRISHGYGWGFVRPRTVTDNGLTRFTGTVQYNEAEQYNGSAPAIPDGDLGYELDAGLSWKLLEGYTMSSNFAIWKPGKWFNYACIDRSVSEWKTPTAANNFGTRPNRSLDPIFGLEVTLVADF